MNKSARLLASFKKTAAANSAFSTPTIVHFAMSLLVSALLSAPWPNLSHLALLLGLCGIGGVLYSANVLRRMFMQDIYRPVLEDWLCHIVVPILAYLLLTLSACASGEYLSPSLFGVAAATLILLFTGIHNSWDAVTYHVFRKT